MTDKQKSQALGLLDVGNFDHLTKEEILRRKIGQMIIAGFTGKKREDSGVRQILQWITEGKVGGVILYEYNIESPEQLKKLTKALHKAAPPGWPLVITVDQEGGLVQKLSPEKGFHGFPSAKEVGETISLETANKLYEDMAKELAECGINHTCGPCADVAGGNPPGNVIEKYARSYSEDPEKCFQYSAAHIQAHNKRCVRTSPKHYPGHGDLKGDTHKGFVDATGTGNRERGLSVYENLHKSGLLEAVMTAHIFDQDVDQNYPATLSKKHLQVLRQIGFSGPIFSDDMMMGAIQKHYSLDEAVKRFILAGGDFILFSANKAAWKHVEKPLFEDVKPPDVINLTAQKIEEGGEEAKQLRKCVKEAFERIAMWKRHLLHP